MTEWHFYEPAQGHGLAHDPLNAIVGPRPIVDDEVPRYSHRISAYKRVRPGVTGMWQVNGRSDTSYAARVKYDSYYVRNWSVLLDIRILFKTVGVVLKRDGSY